MGKLTGLSKTNEKPASAAQLQERRSNLRYPLELDLVVRRRGGQSEAATVPGKTVNMSSSGILFEADSNLTPGEVLQVAINWPAKLDYRCPLKMIVSGKVVRCSEGRDAVAILQYAFKTMGNSGLNL